MSQSLPSKEAFVVNVPDIKTFDVTFKYNYFTPDEQTSDMSDVISTSQSKKNVAGDAYVQYLETKVPRYVSLTWSKPILNNRGNNVVDTDVMIHRHKVPRSGTFIADNYKKLVTEESFSSQDFVAAAFHDGDIDNKVMDFVSGTYQQLVLAQKASAIATPQQIATSVKKNVNTLRSTLCNNVASLFQGASGIQHVDSTNSTTKNDFFESLKSVSLYAQVNTKFFSDMTGRCIVDSQSPHTIDMVALHKITSTLKASPKHTLNQSISESEFMTMVPYVSIVVNSSTHQQRNSIELIGYVIDKFEQLGDGTYKQYEPIIIEDIDKQTFVDTYVKYNRNYCYAIRTVALFNVPAIDISTGDVATIQVLFASKQTKRYVKIFDGVAPPPPADITYTWNYETNKLLIHWSFPPNPQRDIKKFQVFRRATLNDPFELLREYDFDDSIVKSSSRENVVKTLTTQMTDPMTSYVDDEFDVNSRYIYTICSIDAHGLTSCYGVQCEISFDIYRNALIRRFVSHSGAPKPYPNLYVEGNGFVNVMHVSGDSSKRLTVIFAPQFYMYEDGKGRTHPVIQTNQRGGCYKLQFTNLDNQKGETLTINVDDNIKFDKKLVNTSMFIYGTQDRNK